MTVALFADLVRGEMSALPQANGTAEEPAERPAARFSPPCPKHETISSDASVFGVTVPGGGLDLTMFEVLGNAFAGAGPTAAIWAPGDAIDCD
jgi:hypothetical protein